MLDAIKDFLFQTMSQLVTIDEEIILLAMLCAIAIIVFDTFHHVSRKRLKETGMQKRIVAKAIDGSKKLPVKDYVSNIQGLAGRPDAIIVENGFVIPVETKPLARKLRDRHIAQLLVYMRLIEEFEGKKPPYGYLILGGKCRRIKIMNSSERQAWLQNIIDEMRAVLAGKPANASPSAPKCAKCDVRSHCKFAYQKNIQDQDVVNIRR